MTPKTTLYIRTDGAVGAGIDDGYVIGPDGVRCRVTAEWQRTPDFSEDDLTLETAVALAACLKGRQERFDELDRTRRLIGLIQTIRHKHVSTDVKQEADPRDLS